MDDEYVAEYASYRSHHDAETLRKVSECIAVGDGVAASWDEYAWLHLEEMVARRIEVQLRSVGDAMAWRVLGFDRRYVHVLSRNERTGPMTSGVHRPPAPEEFVDLSDGTKAALPDTKAGLQWELGRAQHLFDTKGTFAILNDLTNVIRIGDLTEVDGFDVILHEVKTPGKRQDPDQTRRGQQAIQAINSGAYLPGSSATTRIQLSEVPVAHHLRRLAQLVARADRDGYSTDVLETGWVASALSLGLPPERRGPRFPGDRRQEAGWMQAREIAHRKAKLRSPFVQAVSTDTAGRAVEHAPWGIYPFDPDVCARLICDYLLIEHCVSLPGVASVLRRQGVEVRELSVPQPLPTTDREVMWIALPAGEKHPLVKDHLALKALRLTARNLRQPVLETWTLDRWAEALVALLNDPNFRQHESVIPVFAPSSAQWA